MENKYKPNEGEFPVFYKGYIDTLADRPLLETLNSEKEYALECFNRIPDDKANFKYAPEKWSVKQVLMHIIDTEMVFAYRGLAIARGEKQPLPGFNQDEYMANVNVDNSSLSDLITAFSNLRSLNITLFGLLREEDLNREGVASGHPVKARSLGYFIAGHARYHVEILKGRYKL